MKKKEIKKIPIGELLIIVVVIGILSFITYRQFDLAAKKSRDLQRRSDLNDFSKIILAYRADYGKLPSNELINSLWGKSFVDNGYTYAISVPKEKVGSKQYCYEASSNNDSFKLFAEFENKDDLDCKGKSALCGGVEYCYTDIKYVSKTTDK